MIFDDLKIAKKTMEFTKLEIFACFYLAYKIEVRDHLKPQVLMPFFDLSPKIKTYSNTEIQVLALLNFKINLNRGFMYSIAKYPILT